MKGNPRSRCEILKRIDQISFAVDELQEYAQIYGPLTIDCTDSTSENSWKWMEQPFPWEKEGGCR